MLDTDTVITIAQAILTFGLALLGALVSTREVASDRRKRRLAEGSFIAIGFLLLLLIGWQAVRAADAKRQSEQEHRDSQAAFDRANQDAQIERDHSQKERDGLKD